MAKFSYHNPTFELPDSAVEKLNTMVSSQRFVQRFGHDAVNVSFGGYTSDHKDAISISINTNTFEEFHTIICEFKKELGISL